MKESKFENLINRLPIDNDSVIGQAVSWFISKQDPDSVQFKQYENGYEIKVFTDIESAKQARKFWEENVAQHLGGE